MTLHVGTMGWSYGFWRGGFYPRGMASTNFLGYYSKRLNSVEVDNSFYRIPRAENVEEWRKQVPESFIFSLKFPAMVTHMKMLKDTAAETGVFLERVRAFGDKLGALLLQMPPHFKQTHLPALVDYLKALPRDFRYAVEVRNKSLLNNEFYRILRDSNVALVWVDAAKMPFVTEATADFLYVRWVGDRKTVKGTLGKTEVDKSAQVHDWAIRLKPHVYAGTEVYGYFSKYYSGSPTSDARMLIKSLET